MAITIVFAQTYLPFYSKDEFPGVPSSLEQALLRLQMPGVHLNLEERTVDVEAEVCLHEGMLELIACTEGTKEHESIVVMKFIGKIALLMLLPIHVSFKGTIVANSDGSVDTAVSR